MNSYLRIEAVNLDSVLSDTSQLSVIRGSSLLLRQATRELCSKLSEFNSIELEAISTGASTGLYSFDVADQETVIALHDDVCKFLDKYYSDFTFVVDTLPDSGNFQKDQATLINKNRYRQLQQLSLALPEINTTNKKEQVACSLDGIRPVSEKKFKDKVISASVNLRLTHGREERSNFYANELDDPGLKELKFTSDLGSLSASSSYGILNNKIAVLYFDGNKFGSIQHKFCKDKNTRKAFDDEISKRQQGFLRNLLADIKDDPDYLTDKNEVRLEVLMWGGDELLIVVPAWCGIKVLQRFYESVDDWKFPDDDKQAVSMTYAGGLVFSQANAPMYRLRELAKDLAEQVKNVSSDDTDSSNLFDYLVLESMDFPSEPLSTLRKRQYLDKAEGRTVLQSLDTQKLISVSKLVNDGDLSKTQVIALAQVAIQEPKKFKEANKRLVILFEEVNKQIDIEDAIKELFVANKCKDIFSMIQRSSKGSVEIWPWVHLAELWDYLFPAKGGK